MPCTCSICLKLSQGTYHYTHEVDKCPCGICHAARMSKAQGNQSLVKSLIGALRRAMTPKN
jgi:hypothetical protein